MITPPLVKPSLAHTRPVTEQPERKMLPVNELLVEAMEKVFPDRMPDCLTSEPRQLAYLCGQVSVVKWLRNQLELNKKG